jgi:hypothetical protein
MPERAVPFGWQALLLLLHLSLSRVPAAGSVIDSNPADVLPDGTPTHYAFTRNGSLNVLVTRVRWPDEGRDDIEIGGNLNMSLLDTSLYYRDSSYGTMDMTFTHTPIVDMTTAAQDSTSSTIKDEALTALETLGFHYCGGPCGTAKAKDGGAQSGYDAVLLAMRRYN